MDKYPTKLESNPTSSTITDQIINACHEAKGRDIVALDVSDVFDLADHFIIVSGRSDRQVQGICNKITSALEEENISPLSIEGFDDGHWILIDFSDVIVHVFYEPVRHHYDIEGLWLKAKRIDIDLPKPMHNSGLRAA